MTYTSKIITPDGSRSKHIIIKVLNYLFGDLRGQLDGRPTRCSATRSCLVLYYYYFFFLLDFSETPRRIFMKFSGMVYIGLAWPK